MDENQVSELNLGEKFTLVKSIQSRKVKMIKRKQPQWLDVDEICENQMSIEAFQPSLNPHLQQKLKAENIQHLFPVQIAVIREVLLGCGTLGPVHGRLGFKPRDICCSAPTGTGKTLAYILPILQVLMEDLEGCIRCLVVVPTADLASQVARVFSHYANNTNIKICLINGHKSFYAEQSAIINNGESVAQVLVATPGRLVDHINLTQNFNLSRLRYLVLDEADRLMDEVKQDWLGHVEAAVGQRTSDCLNLKQCWVPTLPLQKLLFSATLSHDPEKFNQLQLYQPKLLKINSHPVARQNNVDDDKNDDDDAIKYIIPSSLQEMIVECGKEEKAMMLLHLIDKLEMQQVLCFTNSVRTTHRLSDFLRLVGRNAQQISSSLNINRRQRILQQFHNKRISILLCTDAMCRGMDVAGVDWVVNYDSPPHLRTYTHRAGRTARANQSGTCLTLLEKKEILHFKKMISRRVKEIKVKSKELKALRPLVERALQQLKLTHY